ncbi:MAG: hypothetical protein M1834_004452 [Cirrosporium novae-zelandiae]|nr:MAG: hypothetical protein M1834_004452 [Cirrosporium novae-zelandiae]
MFQRGFLRSSRFSRTSLSRFPHPAGRRLLSTPPNHSQSADKVRSRIEHFESRLPRFLQKYTRPLRTAPVTHIASFLLLHEITAIVPLVGLAATFHYSHWLPAYFSEGKYITDGIERFGRYFRRKGWIGIKDAEEVEEIEEDIKKGRIKDKKWRGKWWDRGEVGARWVVEVATAYTITKVLLIPRIMFSVWATPGFARLVMVPCTNGFKAMFKRIKGY